MGLEPMGQPPGRQIRALPIRERSGAARKNEPRNLLTDSYGAQKVLHFEKSIETQLLEKLHFPPRFSKIAIICFVSVRLGILYKVETPSVRIVEAKMGRAAFFEPEHSTVPVSGPDFFTIILGISYPP